MATQTPQFRILFTRIMGLLIVSLMNACGSPSQKGEDSYESYDAEKDYFEQKVTPAYAQNFKVSYHKHYKVVRTNAELSSWEGGGNEVKEDVMVLVQRGTPVPELTGALADATVITIPAERVAVNIENGENYIAELGLFDRVVAVGGAISYDDSVRSRVISGDLAQIGYSWHQPANLELLLERKADLFLMNLSNLDFASTLDKSRQLRIPTASVFEWAEKSYLARAEWIKYYSLFFNAEAAANEKFEQVASSVESIKAQMADLPERPSMIWGYYAGKDRWIVHRNSVEAQFMRDAGVHNLLEDFTRPTRNSGDPISSEALLSLGHEANYWMIGDVHSAALPSDNYMNRFDAWRSGRLFHNMKRSKPQVNAFDWYGRGAVRPDLILADLVKLLYPDQLPEHELHFMEHFDKQMTFPLDVNESLYN